MTIQTDIQNLDKQKIPRAFAGFVVANPRKLLFLFFLILAAGAPFLFQIKTGWSQRVWFDKDHELIKQMDQFEKFFGSDEYVSIVIHQKNGIYNRETLKLIKDITEEMWTVSEIIRVESLTNVNIIRGEDEDILINPLVPSDYSGTQAEIELIKKNAYENRDVTRFYVNDASTLAIINAGVRPTFEKEARYEVVINEAKELVKKYRGTGGATVKVLGSVAANNAFREVSANDTKNLIPLMLFLMLALLYWQFRSKLSLIMPFGLIASTVGITFSFLGLLGIIYNSLLGAIPGILFAISIADTVHILTAYYYFNRNGLNAKDSILYSLTKNFAPTLLTSVSTAISFFSLSISEIAPIRDLGILSGIGTLFAWIFTYIFIGTTIVIVSKRLDERAKTKKVKVKAIGMTLPKREIIQLIDRFRWPIAFGFISFTALFLYIGLQNEVNSDPIKYFSESTPLRKSYDFVHREMDGLRGLELMIDSGVEDGIKDPKFLNKLEEFSEWLLSDPRITRLQSFKEVVKKMHQVLMGGDQKEYRIPDNQNTIAESLFLYTLGLPQGTSINHLFSSNNRYMRMKMVWTIEKSKESSLMAKKIEKEAMEKFNLNVKVAGNGPIFLEINDLVVISFFKSMGLALLLVSGLLLFIYRDIVLAISSLFPNVIPLCFGAGLMMILGKYIDIGTSIVCTVCVGIAVDDTIHFISSYKQHRKDGLDAYSAIEKTYAVTGLALVTTTMLLVIGFGSFILADFVPNHNFGLLSAYVLVMALFTDLIFLPAIILIFDKTKTHHFEDTVNDAL
jgi:predicted RND superfamily exporter protein